MRGRILYNCLIHTLDDSLPRANAMVVYDGKILAVGSDDRLLAEYGGWCDQEDMGGKVIIPGLMDAHMHLKYYVIAQINVDCETATRAECIQRLKERAAVTPEGEWITGWGFNQNAWPEGAGDAQLLDEVSVKHPIMITQKSGHSVWVNSLAYKLAGIDRDTADPEGGSIGHKADGSLDGILYETGAEQLVSALIPEPGEAQLTRMIREIQPKLWAMGLTGLQDLDGMDVFAALQNLQAAGELKLRMLKGIPLEQLDHAVALGLHSGFGNDMLRIGNIKGFMDGAIGPLTAAMFKPYEDNPESTGMLLMDGEALFEHGKKAADAGLAMEVHAIGDRANHEALNAFANLRAYEKEHLPGSHLRHRIEHVQLLHPKDLNRLAELDVIASYQPLHATSDMYIADKHWGKRSATGYALRSQIDAGARYAYGSDAPVESINPFTGVHAAVTRRRADGSPGPEGWYPEQRVSVMEALRGYTQGAAYGMGMEDRLGRLLPGYLADLLVLDEDPFTIDPMALKDIQPRRTMVAGEWVYQRG